MNDSAQYTGHCVWCSDCVFTTAMWELDYLEQCGNSDKDFEMVSAECFLNDFFLCVHSLLEINDVQLSEMHSKVHLILTLVQLNPTMY